MIKVTNKKTEYLLLFSAAIFIFLAYFKLSGVFYLQDEWQGLGNALSLELITGLFYELTPLQVVLGEGRILSRLLGYILLAGFPFNTIPLFIYSISFHILNYILVYFLAKKLLKEVVPSLFAALFFALGSVQYSAVSWYSTSIGTLPSTTLILISIILFFKYLNKKKLSYLFYIFLTLYISLLFKETGVFLFVFFPLFFIFTKRLEFKKILKTFFPFIVFFTISTVYRIYGLRSITTDTALFLTGSSKNYFKTLIIRLLTYPVTSFSLIFFPPEFALIAAREVTTTFFTFVNEQDFLLFSQTTVLGMLSLIASFILGISLIFVQRKLKAKEKRQLLFWISFVLFSYFPYVIISKGSAYLESRYYYVPSVGSGIILGVFLKELIKNKKLIFKVLFITIFSLFLYFHINYLQIYLTRDSDVSIQRKHFLFQLKTIVPKISANKNVFFIQGDADYYSVGNIVPFQQGMGYTLMVYYFDQGIVPDRLVAERNLWEIGSQGYLEQDSIGFGYFTEYRELDKYLSKNVFDEGDVISLFYDSKKEELIKLFQIPTSRL